MQPEKIKHSNVMIYATLVRLHIYVTSLERVLAQLHDDELNLS